MKKFIDLGYLWLDSSRVFRYAGNRNNTTATNIQKFLSQIPLTFKQNRTVTDLNIDVPLIAEGEGRWLDSISFYSFLFHHEFHMSSLRNYIPGKNGPLNRLCTPNLNVLCLYRAAFNQGSWEDHKVMPTEIRIKDSSLFFEPTGERADENWKINHQYTYDVKVPMSRANDIYTIMQRDLALHFGLKAEVQLLEKECWVLEPLDRRLFFFSEGEAHSNTGRPKRGLINRYKNLAADKLWLKLKEYFLRFSPLPLVNQLSYSGPMNFEIHQNVLISGNIELFREALRKNGMSIRRTRAKMPVLVITD